MKSSRCKSNRLLFILVLALAQFTFINASAGELNSKRGSIVLHAEMPSYAGAKMSLPNSPDLAASVLNKSQSGDSTVGFHFDVGQMTGKEVRITTGLAKYGSPTLTSVVSVAASTQTAVSLESVSQKAAGTSSELVTVQVEAF